MKLLEKMRLPHVGFRKIKSILAIFLGFILSVLIFLPLSMKVSGMDKVAAGPRPEGK